MATRTDTGPPASGTETDRDTSTRARAPAPPAPEADAPEVADPGPNEILALAEAAAPLALPRGLPRRQRAFLTAFAVTGNVSRACVAAGVARATVYRWRDATGPAGDRYRAAYRVAEEAANDVLTSQAFKLAVEGTVRPVVSKGVVVTHVREYEPKVLLALLAARLPETFGRRQLDVKARLTLEDLVAGAATTPAEDPES